MENTAVIGPAGETEVRFACIVTPETRAVGRGGLGAVLGAKNLKAITFSGDSPPELEIPPLQMDVHRFGPNAGVDDVLDVMRSNEQCDRYGIDTSSAGSVVSAYLAAEDEFGNTDLIEGLLETLTHREGEGDLLAEGLDLPRRTGRRKLDRQEGTRSSTADWASKTGPSRAWNFPLTTGER